ncbi:G-alpha-domain-containing protein [Rickenella mellea]|uniref:G-alpha-domain-containing protein n=1 Tax=Rickenella mellea TaxID=50990 RepID=A0A4Y7Q2K3_9AGAM|nr:G-alpha-domain-containing protein [Rickenella mellea]
MPSKSAVLRPRSSSDPFTAALLPPPNETPEQRERRLQEEYEAIQRSNDIDEQLKRDGMALRKHKECVKVLLLGQSESGKSTTLKQFQLLHTPAAFHAERIAWRSVIYLNLLRSIRRILEALLPPTTDDNPDESMSSATSSSNSQFHYANRPGTPNAFSDAAQRHFERYAARLAPLVALETRLMRQLACPDDEEATHLDPALLPPYATPTPDPNSYGNGYGSSHHTLPRARSVGASTSKELALRPTSKWKQTFAIGGRIAVSGTKSEHTGEIRGWWEDPDDPVHVLHACADGEYGMVALWRDSEVRSALARRRVRMEESSGFYLDEIERITAKRYIPTDGDVLRARLKTLGVIEHTFTLKGHNGIEWKIYDVGGARNQRQTWAPYFDDVNAIIFLAPISAFDQVLAEDARVNRLEDSLLLWRSLAANKLLANVNIILFLNKCDLLRAKLNAGVLLRDHMISYGDRPNDYDSVSKYFRNKFGALHQSHRPNKERELYIHLTSVTDTRNTSKIIADVRDIILKANLKGSRLI